MPSFLYRLVGWPWIGGVVIFRASPFPSLSSLTSTCLLLWSPATHTDTSTQLALIDIETQQLRLSRALPFCKGILGLANLVWRKGEITGVHGDKPCKRKGTGFCCSFHEPSADPVLNVCIQDQFSQESPCWQREPEGRVSPWAIQEEVKPSWPQRILYPRAPSPTSSAGKGLGFGVLGSLANAELEKSMQVLFGSEPQIRNACIGFILSPSWDKGSQSYLSARTFNGSRPFSRGLRKSICPLQGTLRCERCSSWMQQLRGLQCPVHLESRV